MPCLPDDMRWAIATRWGGLIYLSDERREAIQKMLRDWYPEKDLYTQHDRSIRWKRLKRKGFRIVKVRITEVK